MDTCFLMPRSAHERELPAYFPTREDSIKKHVSIPQATVTQWDTTTPTSDVPVVLPYKQLQMRIC